MAEHTLTASPILGGIDRQIGACRIVEQSGLALVSVAVPLGGEATLREALTTGWGLEFPAPTQSSITDAFRAIQTTQEQIMLIFQHDGPDAGTHVKDRLAGAGYVTDQTDAWVALEFSGPQTRAALERICPIDLHPDVFPEGASARTVMEHLGAIVVRLGDDQFLLLSASSSAASFLHAIETSVRNVAD